MSKIASKVIELDKTSEMVYSRNMTTNHSRVGTPISTYSPFFVEMIVGTEAESCSVLSESSVKMSVSAVLFSMSEVSVAPVISPFLL